MDRLWAPWRIRYIRKKQDKQCVFCKSRNAPKRCGVFLESQHSFCILNAYPYNNGHSMVAPKRHVAKLSRLTDAEALDLFKTISRATVLLDKVLRPEGYNIGVNTSDVAGAGIKDHLHIHIVPRWKGDTNFMPTLYGTKVISQSLEELLKQLKRAASGQKSRR